MDMSILAYAVWGVALASYAIVGISEMIWFASLAPGYYMRAIPIFKKQWKSHKALPELTAKVQQALDRYEAGYKKLEEVWIFRYPNYWLFQPYVVFGFLRFSDTSDSEEREVFLEVKTFGSGLVCILAMSLGIAVHCSITGQFEGILFLLSFLYLVGVPFFIVPMILWQRVRVRGFVRLLDQLLEQ